MVEGAFGYDCLELSADHRKSSRGQDLRGGQQRPGSSQYTMRVPTVPKPLRLRIARLSVAGGIAVLAGGAWLAMPARPARAAVSDVTSGGDASLALDELAYERLMEESLKQAVASYLGSDRFIIQVRVALSRSGLGPQFPMAMPAPPQAAALPPSDGAFVLPGLPGLTGQPVTSANQVPPPEIPGASSAPPVPAIPRGVQVDRQSILLVVDRPLAQADQDFLKTVIDQKADLDYARGDEVRFEQRTFPDAPMPLVASGSAPVPAPSGALDAKWLLGGLAALLLLALLAALVALLRRRPAPAASIELPAGPGPSMLAALQPDSPETESANKKAEREAAILRQELVVMLLEYPDLGTVFVKDLLKKEDGARKAAIVLRALGLQGSNRMFTGLSPDDWSQVEAEFPASREASPARTHRAIEEAYQVLVAERAATLSTGGPRKNSPFAFLDKLDDSQIVYILEEEGIKIKALVLSQLPIKRAAELIRRLPVGDQGAIATAIGDLEAVPVTAFQSIADKLAHKAERAPSFNAIVTDGVKLLVNILDNADNATEQRILDTLKTTNPSMMRRVKEIYFTFADIPKLPQGVLKDAAREMDPVRLALALRGAPENMADLVLEALTEKRRSLVVDAVEDLEDRQPEPTDVEGARRELVGRIRELVGQGRFSLKSLAED